MLCCDTTTGFAVAVVRPSSASRAVLAVIELKSNKTEHDTVTGARDLRRFHVFLSERYCINVCDRIS